MNKFVKSLIILGLILGFFIVMYFLFYGILYTSFSSGLTVNKIVENKGLILFILGISCVFNILLGILQSLTSDDFIEKFNTWWKGKPTTTNNKY